MRHDSDRDGGRDGRGLGIVLLLTIAFWVAVALALGGCAQADTKTVQPACVFWCKADDARQATGGGVP